MKKFLEKEEWLSFVLSCGDIQEKECFSLADSLKKLQKKSFVETLDVVHVEKRFFLPDGTIHGLSIHKTKVFGRIDKETIVNYVFGKRQGKYKEYISPNYVVKGTYENGKKTGVWETCDERRKYCTGKTVVKEIGFLDGLKHGKEIVRKNGNVVLERNWRNGKLHGSEMILKKHYAWGNGTIVRFSNWENGKRRGEFLEKTEDGQKLKECFYGEKGFHGFFKTWWKNGNPQEISLYSFGKKQYFSAFYNVDGSVRRTSFHCSGRKNATIIWYNTEGKPIKTRKYFLGRNEKTQ